MSQVPADVAAAHGRTGAVIVTGPGNLDVAALLGAALDRFDQDETRVVYPDGVNWKVSELLDLVIEPARYAALTHRNIVVADAHQAQAAAHDKLLKSLEEPFTDTTFWLCHPEAATLPTTLRGRAVGTVHLLGPTEDEAHERLAAAGAVGARARRLLELADHDVDLAVVVAKFDMDDVLTRYCQTPFTATPHLVAGQVLLAAAHLAVALGHKTARPPTSPRGKGDLDSADLSRLRPDQRARLRRLTTRLLDRWERELLSQVESVVDAAGMGRIDEGLRGIAAARRGQVFNTPPATLLTRAVTALCVR